MSGSGISWATCMSAPRSRQITMPVPHHSVFYRPDALPAAQPTASKHWRHTWLILTNKTVQLFTYCCLVLPSGMWNYNRQAPVLANSATRRTATWRHWGTDVKTVLSRRITSDSRINWTLSSLGSAAIYCTARHARVNQSESQKESCAQVQAISICTGHTRTSQVKMK